MGLLAVAMMGQGIGAVLETDVMVYGGTPAGIMAAVAAARLGERVLLIEPGQHLGGVVAGGLTRSDVGRDETIGGLAREFFNRVLAYYRDTYGLDSPQVRDCRQGYYFEPSVAERIFEEMVKEQPSIVVQRGWLLEGVEREGKRIVAAFLRSREGGLEQRVVAAFFVDASYEGDLMAFAGVPYRVGREGEEEYGESLAGAWVPREGGRWERRGFGIGSFFSLPQPPKGKSADDRLQAYNYRLCLTDDPDLRVLPPRPPVYDPQRYAILLAAIKAGLVKDLRQVLSILPVPNRKYDANNHWPWQSSDFVGGNYLYLKVPPDVRERIAREHRYYLQGMLYFLQNDPQVPEEFRAKARQWGLAKDEFVDNENWPYQLYVREARRMVGAYVMREQDCRWERAKPDSVGIGSFMIDSHAVQRFLWEDGLPVYEGMLGGTGTPTEPYEIPYRALIPKEVENLLVPVCFSATHVAYCTMRMEPVYMMMGHACGVAAHLAHGQGSSVQEIPVEELQGLLRQQGALLEAPGSPQVAMEWEPAHPQPGQPVQFRARVLAGRVAIAAYAWDFDADGQMDSNDSSPTFIFPRAGVFPVLLRVQDAQGRFSSLVWEPVKVGEGGVPPLLVDDEEAEFVGEWPASGAIPGFIGPQYRHSGENPSPEHRALFRFRVPRKGLYRVLLFFTPHPNRATRVPVVVRHHEGESRRLVDQRQPQGPFPFVVLGVFPFEAEGEVEIGLAGADGYVIADAVMVVEERSFSASQGGGP